MDHQAILSKKKIIITGASSGIGRALAKGLASRGAHMGLMSRSLDRLRDISLEIEQQGGTAILAQGDVQQSSQVKSGIESLIGALGGVDALINNAGTMELNTFPKDYEEIDRILDTNLKGSLYCSLAVMPYFTRQKSGSIINTSSVLSLEQVARHMGNSLIYAISKAGINMFTKALAPHLVADGILINSILPGFVKTPMIKDVPEQVLQQFGVIQPEELVPYYAFFASNTDKRVTGQLIPVEIFQSATRFAKKLFNGQVPSWEELAPRLEQRYSDPKYRVYGDPLPLFKENRKLLLSLIEWK